MCSFASLCDISTGGKISVGIAKAQKALQFVPLPSRWWCPALLPSDWEKGMPSPTTPIFFNHCQSVSVKYLVLY